MDHEIRREAPRIRLDVREEPYWLIGSTATDLRRTMALTGPKAHGGYARWEIDWRYGLTLDERGYSADAITIDVSVRLSLPRWTPPPNARRELVRAWERYLSALELHERGHIELAHAAGHTLARDLSRVGPCASIEAFHVAASEAAKQVIAALEEREASFDRETRHGRTQGVEFPEDHSVESHP